MLKGISVENWEKVYKFAKENNKDFNELLDEVMDWIYDGFDENEVVTWLNDF